MEWQPTNNLRFKIIETKELANPDFYGLPVFRPKQLQVLQQMWTDTYGRNEWRDIPSVKDDERGGE